MAPRKLPSSTTKAQQPLQKPFQPSPPLSEESFEEIFRNLAKVMKYYRKVWLRDQPVERAKKLPPKERQQWRDNLNALITHGYKNMALRFQYAIVSAGYLTLSDLTPAGIDRQIYAHHKSYTLEISEVLKATKITKFLEAICPGLSDVYKAIKEQPKEGNYQGDQHKPMEKEPSHPHSAPPTAKGKDGSPKGKDGAPKGHDGAHEGHDGAHKGKDGAPKGNGPHSAPPVTLHAGLSPEEAKVAAEKQRQEMEKERKAADEEKKQKLAHDRAEEEKEARKVAQAEKKAQEDAEKKKKAQEEAARKAHEEAERKKKDQEEAERKRKAQQEAHEEAERKKKAQEEAKREAAAKRDVAHKPITPQSGGNHGESHGGSHGGHKANTGVRRAAAAGGGKPPHGHFKH